MQIKREYMSDREIMKNWKVAKSITNYDATKQDCRCDGAGYIEWWYDENKFKKMSVKDKLWWLKFEFPNEYEELSKEDKKKFITDGYTYCPICKKAY